MEWQRRFKTYLKEQGLSKTEIAGRMKVTPGGLGHWLSGHREINLSDFMALCRYSGADPRYILFGEPETKAALLAEIRKLLPPEPHSEPKTPHTLPEPAKKLKKNKQLA